MGIIELIIIIWVIAALVKKSRKSSTAGKNNVSKPSNVSRQTTDYRKNLETAVRKGYQTVAEQAQKYSQPANQEELKRRLQEKYAGHTVTQVMKNTQSVNKPQAMKNTQSVNKPQPSGNMQSETKTQPLRETDILERASANVSEDFSEKQPDNSNVYSEILGMSGKTELQIVQEADTLAEIDLGKIYETPQVRQDSELMRMVSDIMAKGVDTELTFQRDFVAEGLAMINNITL